MTVIKYRVDVIEVVEQPDGSARVIIDLDQESLSAIIEWFVISSLEQHVERQNSD